MSSFQQKAAHDFNFIDKWLITFFPFFFFMLFIIMF